MMLAKTFKEKNWRFFPIWASFSITIVNEPLLLKILWQRWFPLWCEWSFRSQGPTGWWCRSCWTCVECIHVPSASILFSARRLSCLGNRTSLGGIALLLLFIYKYVADTSFVLISCVATSDGVSRSLLHCSHFWYHCLLIFVPMCIYLDSF